MEKILSTVSDSDATMKCMKRLITNQWKKATAIPCVLHVLNLASHAFLISPCNKETSEGVIKIASFFNKSYYCAGLLADTCKSVVKYERAFVDLFDENTDEAEDNFKRLPVKIRPFIKDDRFMLDIKTLIDIFEPIMSTIKVLELDSSSRGARSVA